MSLMGQVFLNLLTPKDLFTYMHIRSCFWKLFASKRVNRSLKLLKSREKYFYPTFSSVSVNLRQKKLFSFRFGILWLSVNTLTADYEYPRSNREKLPLQVQTQLPEKLEIFSRFFIAFLESPLNFEHLLKKMSLLAQVFLKLLTPKDVFTYIYERSCFWKLFGSERVNESLKPRKNAEKYFNPSFSSFWVNLR